MTLSRKMASQSSKEQLLVRMMEPFDLRNVERLKEIERKYSGDNPTPSSETNPT